MREILFRAKRVKKYCKDQDWTEGVPFIDSDGDCIMATHCSKYVVDAETVGQYTGLTDKNGKKIFEGDIVRIIEHGKVLNGKIIFKNTYNGGWVVADITEQSSCSLAMRNNVEVIGNIYDNPELLKGGAE